MSAIWRYLSAHAAYREQLQVWEHAEDPGTRELARVGLRRACQALEAARAALAQEEE